MCPPLPSETDQIKLVSGIICFPMLWEDFSRFLFFLLSLGCGCGRIVKPYAAERQAGLLFNTMEESQMNSIKLHLAIGYYCKSSVNANCSKSFGAMSPTCSQWHGTPEPAKTECLVVSSCVHNPSIHPPATALI